MDNELRLVLEPIGILGSVWLGIIFFTKVLTDYLIRRKLVNKGLVGADAAQLLQSQKTNRNETLKWGLIILFGGIGLIILEAVPYDASSPLPFGVFAVSLSLGFLTYFGLARKLNDEQ